MASSFYVYLPSNSRGENNTTSSFTVQLPKKLVFNSNWVVALTNIIYPMTWPNLGTDEHQFMDIKWKNGGNTRLYFPKMSYKNFNELSTTIQTIIKEGSKRLCKIKTQQTNEPVITGAGIGEEEQLAMAVRAANRVWNNIKDLAKNSSDMINELKEMGKENADNAQILELKSELEALTRDILDVMKIKTDTERFSRLKKLKEAKKAADQAKDKEVRIKENYNELELQFNHLKIFLNNKKQNNNVINNDIQENAETVNNLQNATEIPPTNAPPLSENSSRDDNNEKNEIKTNPPSSNDLDKSEEKISENQNKSAQPES